MDKMCNNFAAMRIYKNQNDDVQSTLAALFPDRIGDKGFEKLFKIAFDNCESEERAKQLMNECIYSLDIVTYDKINIIIWLSNDFSISK
jgi:hypothetical protein